MSTLGKMEDKMKKWWRKKGRPVWHEALRYFRDEVRDPAVNHGELLVGAVAAELEASGSELADLLKRLAQGNADLAAYMMAKWADELIETIRSKSEELAGDAEALAGKENSA